MHDSSQSTTSKSKLLLAGLGLLALSAAVVFNGISSRQSDDKQLQARVQAQSTPTVTLVSPTQASTAPPALELPGRIEAFARASLFARVSGYLKSWHVDIGSRFDRLDHTQDRALRKAGANSGKFDKHNVTQGFLGVNGDAHPGEIAFGSHPCMFCVVFGHGHMPA